MIKTNELRIGNYCTVGGMLTIIPNGIFIDEHWDVVDAIPLTPEWLERMGFNLIEREWTAWVGIRKPVELYRHVNQIDFEVVRDNETGIIHRLITANGDEYGYRDGKELKYVHQLQNLYFALTGEELTIKP